MYLNAKTKNIAPITPKTMKNTLAFLNDICYTTSTSLHRKRGVANLQRGAASLFLLGGKVLQKQSFRASIVKLALLKQANQFLLDSGCLQGDIRFRCESREKQLPTLSLPNYLHRISSVFARCVPNKDTHWSIFNLIASLQYLPTTKVKVGLLSIV